MGERSRLRFVGVTLIFAGVALMLAGISIFTGNSLPMHGAVVVGGVVVVLILIERHRRSRSGRGVEEVQFLTGKDYPWICADCQKAVDDAVEIVKAGGDESDDEAPIMYVYDNGLFCGGHDCDNPPEAESAPNCSVS